MRFALTAAVLFFLAAVVHAGLSDSSRRVVIVNEAVITESDVDAMIERIIPTVLYHREITPEKKERFRKDAIEKLIDSELLYQEAEKLGIEIPETDVQKAFDSQKARFSSEGEFAAALKRKGLTKETFIKKLLKSMVVNKFVATKVGEPAKVGDAEAKDYFEANKGKFAEPEKIELSEIFIYLPPDANDELKAKKTEIAREVLGKVREGGNFCELASLYSEDQLKSKCGNIGSVHRGRLHETLEKAVWEMKSGDVAMVTLETGIIVVKFNERIPEHRLTFDEVKDRIKKDLSAEKWKKLHEEYLRELRSKAKIEIR